MDAWRQFKVFPPAQKGAQGKDVVDTRWVLTWREVNGEKTVRPRLVAKGRRDPDLKDANVGTAGRVSRRSPYPQPISLGVLKMEDLEF